MTYDIRPATDADAVSISAMLHALTVIGKRSLPSDVLWVRKNYVSHPDKISCVIATEPGGNITGLQILRLARPDTPYGTPTGWAAIGTHVHPYAARQGIGKALFSATLEAAQEAGIPAIDAKIGAQNADGLAYYGAMGFQTHPEFDDPGRKAFLLR